MHSIRSVGWRLGPLTAGGRHELSRDRYAAHQLGLARSRALCSVRVMTAPDSPTRSPLTGVTVLDAMSPGVVSCLPDDGVAKVASIMVAHSIHAVVLARGDRTGPLIVTDLELVRAALERADVHVAEIAREPLASLPADAPLDRAVAMMAERYVAHLLATDPVSGDPAGIISSFDVAAVVGGQDPKYARMLRPGPARQSVSARTLAQARVGDVMHPGVITCPADAPLATVALSMAEHRIHCVAVAGIERSGQHLKWGLIGDMDRACGASRRILRGRGDDRGDRADRRAGGRLARAGRRADGRARHEPCGRRRAFRPTVRNRVDSRRGGRLGLGRLLARLRAGQGWCGRRARREHVARARSLLRPVLVEASGDVSRPPTRARRHRRPCRDDRAAHSDRARAGAPDAPRRWPFGGDDRRACDGASPSAAERRRCGCVGRCWISRCRA